MYRLPATFGVFIRFQFKPNLIVIPATFKRKVDANSILLSDSTNQLGFEMRKHMRTVIAFTALVNAFVISDND